MTATTHTNTRATVTSGNAVDTLSRASLVTMAVSSGLIGLWAVGSLISAFVTTGVGNVVKGFMTALTGM